ncbi:hypothetical protein Ancab_016381 [Ancistrocladus abbreviatus]
MASLSFKEALECGHSDLSSVAREDPSLDHGLVSPMTSLEQENPMTTLSKDYHLFIPHSTPMTQPNFAHDLQNLPSDLGMGIVLSSIPCNPISIAPTMLSGLAPPVTIGPNFGPPYPYLSTSLTEGVPNENSATLVVNKDPELAIVISLLNRYSIRLLIRSTLI